MKEEKKRKKMKGVIHYFLMQIVLHTYIIWYAHALVEDWPAFKGLEVGLKW